MANSSTTGLSAATSLVDADLIAAVINVATTPVDKKITIANLKTSLGALGWIPVPDTWTYASATVINVPSGAASIYSVGDKLVMTNSGTKYNHVVAVADTQLTVFGDGVANAAISAQKYSHAATPVGFPSYFTYTPTYTPQTGTFTSVRNLDMYVCVIGKWCHFMFSFDGTTNATPTYIDMTLPIPWVGYTQICVPVIGDIGAGGVAAHAQSFGTYARIKLIGSNFSNGTYQGASGELIYRIL